MAAIILRQSGSLVSPEATVKGAPLSNFEVDNNFSNLNVSIGVLSNLDTDGKANLVVAVNELKSNAGLLSSLATTEKSNIVSSINEIKNGNLSQFASTTSTELRGVISDETGTGSLVFSTSPSFTGTPQAITAANSTSNSMIATTEYVLNALGGFAGSDSPVFSGNVVIPRSFITSNISLPYSAATDPSIQNRDGDTGIYFPVDGQVGITTNDVSRVLVGTNDIVTTLPTRGPNGSVSAPAYSFSGDNDTGIYTAGSGQVNIATNGSLRFTTSTTAITSTLPVYNQDGTAAAPAYTFSGDTNTGLYRTTTDSLGVTTGGTLRLTVNTAQFTGTLPWRGQDGTAAAPALSFSADTNTGIYRTTADSLGIATNGALRLTTSTTAITSTLPFNGPNGTAAAPAFTFSGDNNTGLYLIGGDQLGVTTGGTLRLTVNTAQFTGTLPWRGQDGSVSAPALSFSGDTDTGFYKVGTNSFGVTCGGTQESYWNTNGQYITSLGVGTAPSGTTGEIRATNNITAYYSDERLKKEITPIENALEKVDQIRGVYFKANEVAAEFGYNTEEQQVGVIAQEIEKVLPEVVVAAPFDTSYDENGKVVSQSGQNYKTVRYEKIIPLLIEAIKDLKKEIEDLRK